MLGVKLITLLLILLVLLHQGVELVIGILLVRNIVRLRVPGEPEADLTNIDVEGGVNLL